MAILPRQTGYYDRCRNGYYQGSDGRCYRRSSWNNWGRWIVVAIIILAALFIFFAFACVTARRRRRQGMTPYRGTGWAGGRTPAGHAPAQYTGNQPSYGSPPVGQPAYSPPPQNQGYYGNSGSNQGYYGSQQQSGVELQQPDHSYQPQRGGDQVYNPPSGPPPGKDGIIR